MALTKRERKERLGRGGQKRIAEKLKLSDSLVSAVMNQRTQMYSKQTVRKVQQAVAEEIGVPVEEVFSNAA